MSRNVIGLFIIIVLAAACNSTKFDNTEAFLPEMQSKPDGIYFGEYSVSGTPVKVTLNVTVQNSKIIAIDLIEHRRSPIGKKAETILERIIEEQNLKIDAVSGATASSIAILKAVENALR